MKKDPNRYPKDLNREKVEAIISFYDKHSDEDATAEAEAAYGKRKSTLIEVPAKLLPQVRRLLGAGARAH